VVAATRRVLTRGSRPGSDLLAAQVEAGLIACERSRELCDRHAAHHEHCRVCAQAASAAAQACRNVLRALRGDTAE
jgi:hypothetical protein